ncbi:hypothetical protein HDU92_005645 [Lobulomyces angularis]|nr:hypothetical protein HDU92_005645 [Lobulomyces angularis]
MKEGRIFRGDYKSSLETLDTLIVLISIWECLVTENSKITLFETMYLNDEILFELLSLVGYKDCRHYDKDLLNQVTKDLKDHFKKLNIDQNTLQEFVEASSSSSSKEKKGKSRKMKVHEKRKLSTADSSKINSSNTHVLGNNDISTILKREEAAFEGYKISHKDSTSRKLKSSTFFELDTKKHVNEVYEQELRSSKSTASNSLKISDDLRRDFDMTKKNLNEIIDLNDLYKKIEKQKKNGYDINKNVKKDDLYVGSSASDVNADKFIEDNELNSILYVADDEKEEIESEIDYHSGDMLCRDNGNDLSTFTSSTSTNLLTEISDDDVDVAELNEEDSYISSSSRESFKPKNNSSLNSLSKTSTECPFHTNQFASVIKCSNNPTNKRKKIDPVTRYHKFNNVWKNDNFLKRNEDMQQKFCKIKNLSFHSGGGSSKYLSGKGNFKPAFGFQKGENGPKLPRHNYSSMRIDYVVPTSKLRKDLVWETRNRMAKVLI